MWKMDQDWSAILGAESIRGFILRLQKFRSTDISIFCNNIDCPKFASIKKIECQTPRRSSSCVCDSCSHWRASGRRHVHKRQWPMNTGKCCKSWWWWWWWWWWTGGIISRLSWSSHSDELGKSLRFHSLKNMQITPPATHHCMHWWQCCM